MKQLLLLIALQAPVSAYTLVPDPSSPTGYSYGTGQSRVRVEGSGEGSGYETQQIFVNGRSSAVCNTIRVGSYATTSCTR